MAIRMSAWLASSPASAAAVRNAATVRSNVRCTVAMKSSFLVPKSWKRYGCDTPTCFAMASTGVPWRPPMANSRVAASTISRRRSSLLLRVVAFMVTTVPLLSGH